MNLDDLRRIRQSFGPKPKFALTEDDLAKLSPEDRALVASAREAGSKPATPTNTENPQ